MDKLKKALPLILQAALCCLLWATAIPTLKISYSLLNIAKTDIFNRLVLAGMRFLIAGILIGIYLYIVNKEITIVKGKQWKTVIIFGLLNTTIQYLFFYIGVANTGAIKGVLIDTSKPLMIFVLAHFMTSNEKMSVAKIAGLTMGIIGIIIANFEDVVNGGLDFHVTFLGEGFLIIASLSYAFAALYGKKAMKIIPSIVLNMHQFIIGSILLLSIGLIGAKGYHLNFTGNAVLLLLYSSILSAVAFVVWYQLIHKYGASSVSIYIFLIPVFGSIISSIIFPDEQFSINILISLILMSVGVYLVNRQKSSAGC